MAEKNRVYKSVVFFVFFFSFELTWIGVSVWSGMEWIGVERAVCGGVGGFDRSGVDWTGLER